jgi:hypothetical protein
MERDTSWDNPQLSDGDFAPLKKQREDIIKKWEASGLLDDLNQSDKKNIAEILDGKPSQMLNDLSDKSDKPNMAELLESEASVLLKKEFAMLDELNKYLVMLSEMDNIYIRKKIVLLEGFINKVKREIG